MAEQVEMSCTFTSEDLYYEFKRRKDALDAWERQCFKALSLAGWEDCPDGYRRMIPGSETERVVSALMSKRP